MANPFDPLWDKLNPGDDVVTVNGHQYKKHDSLHAECATPGCIHKGQLVDVRKASFEKILIK